MPEVEAYDDASSMHNWRTVITEAQLKSLNRAIATQSEVVEFDRSHVKLRLQSSSLYSLANQQNLQDALVKVMGPAFKVEFEQGQVNVAHTVAQEEKLEHERAQQARVSKFDTNLVVKEVLKRFGGTVLSDSVQEID